MGRFEFVLLLDDPWRSRFRYAAIREHPQGASSINCIWEGLRRLYLTEIEGKQFPDESTEKHGARSPEDGGLTPEGRKERVLVERLGGVESKYDEPGASLLSFGSKAKRNSIQTTLAAITNTRTNLNRKHSTKENTRFSLFNNLNLMIKVLALKK